MYFNIVTLVQLTLVQHSFENSFLVQYALNTLNMKVNI